TTDASRATGEQTGGNIQQFFRDGNVLRGQIDGPPRSKKQKGKKTEHMTVPFSLETHSNGQSATLRIGNEEALLEKNSFSNWIVLEFSAKGEKTVSGIARFCLRETGEHVSLYITPVNINPEKPVLPIAKPIY